MIRHVPGTWADAGPALLAALERRRADRKVIVAVMAEVVVDPADGTTWVVLEHGTASSAPIALAAALREVARALEAAAAEQEARVQ
jgi:hypothetical protein